MFPQKQHFWVVGDDGGSVGGCAIPWAARGSFFLETPQIAYLSPKRSIFSPKNFLRYSQLGNDSHVPWLTADRFFIILGFYRYRYNTAIYTGTRTVFWVPVFFVKYRKYRYFPVFFFILASLSLIFVSQLHAGRSWDSWSNFK